jgi:hypothetical protein
MAHPYHDFVNYNINDFNLKDCISKGIAFLLTSGRTALKGFGRLVGLD